MTGAVRRMYRWMVVFAVAGSLSLLAWRGPRQAGGFALGAALSILNFHWLKGAVDALGGSAARAGKGVIAKFVLRYALMIAAGYVIFRSSVLSLPWFLGGLFVFVAGVLAEMIVELFAAGGSAGSENG